MLTVRCEICKKSFKVKPSTRGRGWGKYCSKACQFKGQETGKIVSCFICHRQVYRNRSDVGKSKSGKYFCGKSCQAVWRNSMLYFGENHSNWKGGTATYKNVLLRSQVAESCRRCKTKDKRVLIVHHLNGDRNNNSAKNLIWLCHNCHFLIHYHQVEYKKLMETMV